jgi:hypothetical protein
MREDFLLDENKDFATADGDFVTGRSEDQDVELLLVLHKGELKENPTIGVGISNYIGKQNTSIADMRREIKVGLKADNYNIKKLTIEADGNFDLDYELDE